MKKLPLTPPKSQFYAFCLFHKNLFAPWALLPLLQLEMDLGYSLPKTLASGSVCGKMSPSRGQIALSTADSEERKTAVRAVTKGLEAGAHCSSPRHTVGVRSTALLSAVTNPFLSKGTGPRGVARAGLDVLHALLCLLCFWQGCEGAGGPAGI